MLLCVFACCSDPNAGFCSCSLMKSKGSEISSNSVPGCNQTVVVIVLLVCPLGLAWWHFMQSPVGGSATFRYCNGIVPLSNGGPSEEHAGKDYKVLGRS